jgi:hypothetical protein
MLGSLILVIVGAEVFVLVTQEAPEVPHVAALVLLVDISRL